MVLERASGLSVTSLFARRVVVVSICLFSLSCFDQPLEPVVPSWDTILSIPLVNRKYSLLEIVEKDTSLLHVGVGGQIVYATSVHAKPTYIGDLITVSLKDTSLRVKFGAFKVSVPAIDLPISFPWLPQGATVPVPDTTLNVADLRDTISTFQRVTFSEGTIALTLQNNLPVPMEVVTPLRLLDRQGDTVATFLFTPSRIEPNSSRTASDTLAGRTIDNVLTVTGVSFHTPGSQTPVPIPFGTLFSAHIVMSNLKARQAVFASIPPQRLTDNDTTHAKLDDSTLVKEVLFKSGLFTLKFTSQLNLEVRFKYRLNELLRRVGNSYVPYEDSLSLPAGTTDSQSVNLAGAKIQSQNQGLLKSLEIISSIILPTGSPTPVTMNDTDKVIISIRRDTSLIADSVIGVLKPTVVKINTVIPMHFGSLPKRFSGQISIPSAMLALWTSSTINFPMDLNVRISARKNDNGDSAFLSMPFVPKRLLPGDDLILFDSSTVGNFLSQFSGRLPNELRIEGKTLVNPPDVYNPTLAGVGSIGRNNSLGGKVDLQIPLMLGVVDGTFRDTVALGDTTADGHKDYTINKDAVKSVGSATVFIQVKNAMPVQVGFMFQLLDSGKASLLQVPQSGQPIQLNAASVDADGNVTIPANSTVSFELNEDEVHQFIPAEHLAYSLNLVTTPGVSVVRFKTSDYVQVRLWSKLIYRVNR